MKLKFRNLLTTAGIVLATAFTSSAAQELFVANRTTNSIETYNAATGALISNSFVTGLSDPQIRA